MTAGRLPIAGHTASACIAVFITILSLSLFEPLMVWVLMLTLCTLFVRISLYLGWYQHTPSQRTINLLAILSSLALAWFSFDLGLLLSMINLLVIACSLKLITLSKRRDFLQLFACGLFLIGCGLIFQQGMVNALFYLAMLLVLLYALISFYAPKLIWQKRVKRISFQLLQALPIAIILFLTLPHLGPLWKMPTSKSTKTGLAEKVTPGDIAQLSQSDELVFHATFEGEVPPRQERYWRALTLEAFDGKSWEISPYRQRFRQRNQRIDNPFLPSTNSTGYVYQVIAEETGRPWLYALDIAIPATVTDRQQIWSSRDYQLIAHQPLMSKRAYNVTSYPASQLPSPDPGLETRLNLMVPEYGNPQTQQWVANLRAKYPDNREFVAEVLDYFVQQPFVYTLSPPTMRTNFVDTFLFEERAGFCSHYASAMTYVLRLAGIPARMVTGYQGGEMLKRQVVSVYQYDAHAWLEAMVNGTDWTRFDPTSVVAPARIATGLRDALTDSEELNQYPLFLDLDQTALLKEVTQMFNNLNYLWSRWVLGFDNRQQKDLFRFLIGQLTPLKLTVLLLGSLLAISILLALYFLPRWERKSVEPFTLIYFKAVNLICHTLDVKRLQHEPPMAFFEQASPLLSSEANACFNEITLAFITHHYQKRPHDERTNKAELAKMRDNLKTLKREIHKIEKN